MPGFDEWEERVYYSSYIHSIGLEQGWGLRFFDYQQSGSQMYAAFQVTDSQQNTFMSDMLPVSNPNLRAISVLPGQIAANDYSVTCHVVRDVSPLDASISLCLEIHAEKSMNLRLSSVVINGTRSAEYSTQYSAYESKYSGLRIYAGETEYLFSSLSPESLTGISQLQTIEIILYNGEQAAFLFRLADCDLSALAPALTPVLAETETDGVRMRLMSLKQESSGKITGVLQIINQSEDHFRFSGTVAVDGVCLSDSVYMDALPGTDEFVRFTAEDSAMLQGTLNINGREGVNFLGRNHLLESLGVEAVHQIKLMSASAYDWETTWTLELKEPIPLRAASAQEKSAGQTLPLLEGPISASVERVLIADNGVGLRLALRNDTDDDVGILVQNHLVNGIDVDNQYPDSFLIPAHGITIACVGIDARHPYLLDPGSEITEIGITFRCRDMTSPMAYILLNEPVPLGTLNGCYLSCGGFTTLPVQFLGADGLNFLSDEYEGETVSIRITGEIKNARTQYPESMNAVAGDAFGQGLKIGVRMEVENKTGIEISAISTNFILNGEYETQTEWIAYGIAPAQTEISTWYIQPEELLAAGRADSIQFTLNIRPNDDYSQILESIPISVELAGPDLAQYLHPAQPLDEIEADGLVWQLISAKADADGRITGWLNAINVSDHDCAFYYNVLLAEGIRGESFLPSVNLKKGSHCYIPFTFENCSRVSSQVLSIPGTTGYALPQADHLLQRQGIREVSRLSFAMGNPSLPEICYEPRQFLNFTLPEPMAIPPADLDERPRQLLMREGELSVWLNSILVGNGGLSLELEYWNDGGESVVIGLEDVYVDDHFTGANLKRQFYSFLPHTRSTVCAASVINDGLYAGDDVRNIHLSFRLNGPWDENTYSSSFPVYCSSAWIHLKTPVPLNRTDGLFLTSEAYDVEPARAGVPESPSVVEAVSLPLRSTVHPRTLTAPVSEEKARLFAKGTVTICKRWSNPWGEADVSFFTDELVSLELTSDAEGQISAQYSGLILRLANRAAPHRERTQGNETEIDSVLFQFPLFYECDVVVPDDPAQPPYLDSLNNPDNYSDWGPEIEAGIRTSLHYQLRFGEEAITAEAAEISHIRQDTGEQVDGVTINMALWTLTIQTRYEDDRYNAPTLIDSPCDGYGFMHCSLIPIERLDAELLVVYHLCYTDGTEQVLVEDY